MSFQTSCLTGSFHFLLLSFSTVERWMQAAGRNHPCESNWGTRVSSGEMATATSSKKRGRNHPCEAVFTAPQLPHEIIVEIISRLPVKSLCRFRCVSKLWLSTISTPQFAKTHLDLALQNNTQKQVLIDFGNWNVCSIDWESISAADVINKGLVGVELDNSLKDHPCFLKFRGIMCSSNGLVCIVDYDKDTFLVMNPCTGESRKIPVGSQKYDNYWSKIVHGFGYCSKSDDCKLVRIDGENIGMYSLRAGTWSTSTPQMPYHICWSAYGVPLNGALHWVSSLTPYEEGDYLVVCFDLYENTIREMPMPAPVHDYDNIYDLSLGVINGCLCALYRDDKQHAVVSFWVMREYNNGESWTKISTSIVPVDTLGLDKKRTNRTKAGRKIVLCNFENGTHGIPTGGKFGVDAYVESLISPNHYVGE